MSDKKTWVEMDNGKVREAIDFIAWIRDEKGVTLPVRLSVPNPPIWHGNPDLFKRLSFETIRDRFALLGYVVGHIIRGECSENGGRACYVYAPQAQVPFATIRPAVFVRDPDLVGVLETISGRVVKVGSDGA